MRNYKARVIRRWWVWAVSTVVMLLILLGLGYAFLNLADDVVRQREYMLLIGGLFIVLSFVLGQAMSNILVKSWDTWLGDLGPTQIEVLREELAVELKRKKNGE